MTSEKTDTRQKICTAAKNLFSTHGYNQTTIDDIITAAGVTKGAFYHYFNSKEIICSEIIDIVQNEYQNIFEESLPAKLNPLEKLKALIKQILNLNRSGRWVNCRLMLRLGGAGLLQPSIKQKLDDFWQWYIDQYRLLITQCRDLNLISDKLSVQQQVDIVMSTLIGNVWTKVIFDSSLDDEIVDFIIEKL